MTYKIENAKKVNMEYVYKKNLLSHWKGRKNNNDNTSMTYPNGEIIYNGDVRPNYEKLINIIE
ncbi:MAG: hypothetical protein ACQEWL_15780 [Pseudomonadota bacterium]